MVVFPTIAAAIAVLCAATVGIDGWRRPKPDKAAWVVAFALFAVAAGAEVAGELAGWSAPLARLYYLAGAVLVVGFLALGELYLLAPRRVGRATPGVALLLTALAATVVLDAPVDAARLPIDGWRAIERGPVLVAFAVGVNLLGTLVLVGGALYSAARFARSGAHRHRAIGCAAIAAGTLVVAAGGSATRLGRPEFLYVAMAAGVALIFAGYLETRRPDAPRTAADATGRARHASRPPIPMVPLRAVEHVAAADDDGIALVGEWLGGLDQAALSERCRVWSAAAEDGDALTRPQAREIWALRLLLPPAAKPRLDALPAPIQRQLAEVYFGVFSPGNLGVEPGPATPADRPRQAAG